MSKITIFMPKVGLTAEEGEVSEWLFEIGQSVQEGETVVLVETEKVTVEIDAPATGVLVERTAPEGTVVPIGGVIGFIEIGE